MEDLDVISTLKKSFNIMLDDPGIIILYAFPAIISLIMSLHISSLFEGVMAGGVIAGSFRNPTYMAEITALLQVILIYTVISLIVGVIVMASVILKVGASENNTFIGFRDALSKGMVYFVPLIIADIIVGLIIAAGFILLIIPGIYFMVKLALFAPACVLETGNLRCIKRSWEITKGRFLKIFYIILIITILSIVIGIGLPEVGSSIAGLIFGPIRTISMTLIYLEAKKAESGEGNDTLIEL